MPDLTRHATALEIQANRFQVVSRLADDLAHEIKNPLHALVINLELVKRRTQAADAAAVVERAEIASGEVMRLNRLVDELLQLLRPMRQGDLVRDLDAVMEEVLPLLALQARLSRVELGYEAVGVTVAVPIRRDALKLVLLNLVAESLDVARRGGGAVRIAAASGDDEVSLSVSGSEAGSPREAEARPPLSVARPGVVGVAAEPPAAGEAPTGTSAPASGGSGTPEEALGRLVVGTLVEQAGGRFGEVGEGPDGRRLVATFPRRTVA